MREKNISIALLTFMVYEAIAQLPLLNTSGGADILSEALMEIFVYVHFFALLVIFIVSVLRRKLNKGILIQLLFVLSILVGMFIWNRIQWYRLPKQERDKLLEYEKEQKNALYNVGCENGKLCFQNHKGEIVIPCIYDAGKPFVDDTITCVAIKGKWGYINRTGKTLIPFQFDDADNFYEGFAAVKQDNLWGFINPKGKWVIAPKYEKLIQPFQNGKALVQIKDDTIKINYPR